MKAPARSGRILPAVLAVGLVLALGIGIVSAASGKPAPAGVSGAPGTIPAPGAIPAPGSRSPVRTPETGPALAIARAEWPVALALCETPQLEPGRSGPCTAALEEIYVEALNQIFSPDPDYLPVAFPLPAAPVRRGPCMLRGAGAHRACGRLTSALAANGTVTREAVAIGRAIVISTARQQGAIRFGKGRTATQLAAAEVAGGMQAPVLRRQRASTRALAGALSAAGATLTVSGQRESILAQALLSLSGPAAPAARQIRRIGFTSFELHSAAALALAGVRVHDEGVISLLGRRFPSVSRLARARQRLGAAQFRLLLAALSTERGGLSKDAGRRVLSAFRAAEAAPSATAARAGIRRLIRVAVSDAGAPGRFLAAAAAPFQASFRPLPPVAVRISAPAGGGVYPLHAIVATRFHCRGAISCVDSGGATGGTGVLDTRTAGANRYTVTATGPAGNTSVATISYTVNRGATRLVVTPATQAPAGTAVATLTEASTGTPIAGETISFTTGPSSPLCSARTNASGVASCSYPPGDALAIAFGGYGAAFAGDPNYGPSSATAAPF